MVNAWQASLGAFAAHLFRWAFLAFIAVNCLAIAAFAVNRSRNFVDRWTPRWLAANLTAIGIGIGGPLAIYTARLVLTAMQTITLPFLGK